MSQAYPNSSAMDFLLRAGYQEWLVELRWYIRVTDHSVHKGLTGNERNINA